MAVELDRDFDAFYVATHRRIVGQIYAMTGSLHEAEDCVQEAYARAWQQWGKLSAEHGHPEAWVRTVATRLAVSSWRKAVNRLAAHRRENRAGAVSGMNPDHLAVVAALRKIPADQRLAIVLYHYAGLSTGEIAAETGAPASTVKARLARGRRALASHLSEFAESLEKPRPVRISDQSPISRRGDLTVSKGFDVTLSDAIDLAAGASQTPGASAARVRGRKRAMRKRIAVTTTSFALVAVCATVGFKASSSAHDSGTPTAPSSASISPSASVPVSATPSASAPPSTHPAATSSAPAGPTGTTPSATAPQATVPSPGGYVAGAWLSPAQLPFTRAGYTTWDHAGGVGTVVGGSVYEQTVQKYTANNSCSSIATASALGNGLSEALTGAQVQVFQSSNFGKVWPDGTIPAHASQYALFYPNATAATAAMNALSADYAACKAQVTGSDPATGTTLAGSVQQTVNDGSAQCWTLLAAQPGSTVANGTIDHTCFVRSGAMIGTVTVSINQVSSLSTVSFTSSDSTVVPELEQDLAAYYSGS